MNSVTSELVGMAVCTFWGCGERERSQSLEIINEAIHHFVLIIQKTNRK